MTKQEWIEQYDKMEGNSKRAYFTLSQVGKMVHPFKHQLAQFTATEVLKIVSNRKGEQAYARMPDWYRKRLRHIRL